MKIHVISDLHLEFADLILPGGDVLILSGDICEAKRIKKTMYDPNMVILEHERKDRRADRYYRFFEEECSKYNNVIYVMGNHEHYGNRYDKTYAMIKEQMPANVHLLEKESIEIDGVLFLGATLWTDMNKHDTLTLYHMKSMMNDYKQITMFNAVKNVYHKLTPEYTSQEHVKTKELFKFFLEENRAKKNLPVIVCTHHAPSKASTHDYYKNDTIMNGAYSSDLSEFILDNPEIKLWTHGHTHDPFDYMIGDTRVICNPRGYKGYEQRANEFDPSVEIDI
jgi:predicted phosphodiesterase